MPEILASFRREPGSKALGCLIYLVAAPFVALFLSLFLSLPLAFAVEQFGAGDKAGGNVFAVLLPFVSLGTLIWSIHDYRRRALLEIVIHADQIVIRIGSKQQALSLDDVRTIRLVPARFDLCCILEPEEGRPLRVPPELAPYSKVRGVLERVLIHRLSRELGECVAAGGVVTVREGVVAAVCRIVQGIGQILLAVPLILSLKYRRPGIALGRNGVLRVRQGWIGRHGGFVLSSRGLQRREFESQSPSPWEGLELVRSDEAGLVIHAPDGAVFAASPFAEHFWPASVWIQSRLKTAGRKPERSVFE